MRKPIVKAPAGKLETDAERAAWTRREISQQAALVALTGDRLVAATVFLTGGATSATALTLVETVAAGVDLAGAHTLGARLLKRLFSQIEKRGHNLGLHGATPVAFELTFGIEAIGQLPATKGNGVHKG